MTNINWTDPAVVSIITLVGQAVLSLIVSKIPSANIVLQILRAILVAPAPKLPVKPEAE